MVEERTTDRAVSRTNTTEDKTHTPRSRLRLRTAEDVMREYGRVYRSMKNQQIEPATGTKLAYVLSLLLKAIEVGTLEVRLSALEQAATVGRGKP